jgi:hypothetical protein
LVPRNDPPSPANPYGSHNPRRVLGHALRDALARSWRAAAGLGSHLRSHNSTDPDLAELRRGLSEADHVAEALLDRGPTISAPATLDVGSLLIRMEPSLRLALAPGIRLTIRDSEPRHLIGADGVVLESIIRRLVDSTARVTPAGGEVTVSAGWLDCISGNWPSDRVPPRRYVRVTIETTASERPGDAWWRVIEPSNRSSKPSDSAASLIERLSGSIMIESAEGQPSRINICLPAVYEDSER